MRLLKGLVFGSDLENLKGLWKEWRKRANISSGAPRCQALCCVPHLYEHILSTQSPLRQLLCKGLGVWSTVLKVLLSGSTSGRCLLRLSHCPRLLMCWKIKKAVQKTVLGYLEMAREEQHLSIADCAGAFMQGILFSREMGVWECRHIQCGPEWELLEGREFFVLNGCPVSLGPRAVTALKEMAQSVLFWGVSVSVKLATWVSYSFSQ